MMFSHSATSHFTVTNAMSRVLRTEFGIRSPIFPLHDRPFSHFQPLDDAERAGFLSRLPETASFTSEIQMGKVKVIVSSTSWTPDEDFSILLESLLGYSQLATSSHPHLPEILAIITGKGPQKAEFVATLNELRHAGRLKMVHVRTAWLSAHDYASLLGAADLGVSLHLSSSGVDLPMKVVDMLGAGLPVVGWDQFESWPELITEGANGLGFRSSQGLLDLLIELFGNKSELLTRLKGGALREGRRRWDDEWNAVAGRLFELC